MKIIEKLCDYIDEEICDAEKYAKCAHTHKEDHPDLSKTFINLAESELDHMNKLHGEVRSLISEYRRTYGEPPEPMLAVYNYLHEKSVDKAASVQELIRRYYQ